MKEIPFTWPKGFHSDATTAGFKPDHQLDLTWLVSDVPAAAAGVYTKNQFQAAPLQLTKYKINLKHQLQAVVINSGNANSFTGAEGLRNATSQANMVAEKLDIDPSLAGVASTGIIGKQLNMIKFKNGLAHLKLTDKTTATEAILTTDTHAKKISVQLELDGKMVTLTGFAKGSGMIHPNMGTTLTFISTDAAVDPGVLQGILSQEITTSFNQITVDGCMSTNDMVLVMANGVAGNQVLNAKHPQLADFIQAFKTVLVTLAKMVAADGEGATKLIEAKVLHAANNQQALQVAKAIVGSNLIKAMIFGQDANWGRIVQAIGQTQAAVDPSHLSIQVGDQVLVQNSELQKINSAALAKWLDQDQIKISVDLNVGQGKGLAWGCDLTYKYVEINAAYED
ncbi:bifunctional glutamate N-acetyltransferase/amino-acid acetyltransferase ArgJ [Eupransor demetentiae]|uniref:Arginine biosynthesis bifunctional protein ArgJ n=1 Tax=Eupransor demetentiae TaxID=3109584 RepID=A0ABP0ER72_9LACO|nr:Glutamate N-acetyltransferase (ornithine transacetylase) (ArgJ) [Lactobacillaceae bacterium LMG 33000]